MIQETHQTKLNIAYSNKDYEKVSLTKPTTHGYIHIAAEIDTRLPFLPNSQKKKQLIRNCKRLCKTLEQKEYLSRATVFKAILIPPGQGAFLKERPNVHRAKFDVSILIETHDIAALETLKEDEVFQEMKHALEQNANYIHLIEAQNIRQIGPVNHDAQGVFLFNYFFADEVTQNLAVWEYTAGWFQQETNLDNSTLLLPIQDSNSEYTIVNHCRWDKLSQILPSILFKPSFKTYVLGNFQANNTAASPILYKLA